MNMSDDVTGVTLQIVSKGADVVAHGLKNILDLIAKLLQELGRKRDYEQSFSKQPKVTGTDLTNIRSGMVDMNALRDNARTLKDTLSMSENALTKEDMKFLSKKARDYNIPIAFSNEKSKDNIFATVRTGDLPQFKQMCTELMKQKIAERPQELGNFRCEAWEIPFLTAHLNKNDLSAQFVQTADGKNLCVFEKKDEKAIKMSRDTFVQQCMNTKKDFMFDRDESGFITIKHLKTGKEISFDKSINKKELAVKMQDAFKIDELEAKLAASRFGEEMLQGEQKEKFFSESAQNDFKQIETNLIVEGEDPICKEYQCWRLTPHADEKPRIVFENSNGAFAVLDPENMTRKQMRDALSGQLGLTDRKHQTALIHKAESIAVFHAQSEAQSAEYTFSKKDFNLNDVATAMGLRKTDENGNTIFTKQLPVSSMKCDIERTEKDIFRVDSTVTAIETDANGVDHAQHDKAQLVLSFSDKKSSIQQLQEMYVKQGVPAHVAKEMAKEVYHKAEMQNPEKPIQIREVSNTAMTLAFGTVAAEISTADKELAASKIASEFGVPAEKAEMIVEKAEEIKVETVQERVDAVMETKTDYHTALNRLTDRDEIKLDNMVICNADDPQKHIVVSGSHNGERIAHDYEAFDGDKKVASFTDKHTKDEAGEPITEANGRHAWTNLKKEMQEQSGIDKDVLVFESQEAYQQYLTDTAFIAQEEHSPLAEETMLGGNGHEMHPEGNMLADVAKPEVPEIPDLPASPQLPPPSMGARM